jgi:hypothetical protein
VAAAADAPPGRAWYDVTTAMQLRLEAGTDRLVFETDTECALTYLSPHRCCCSVWVCFGGTTRANGPARKEDPVPNWRQGSLR